MIQRQLPIWARADHPILRSLLGASQTESRRARLIRTFFIMLGGGLALMVGWVVASDFMTTNPLERPVSQVIFEVLIWPVLFLQLVARLSALALTVGVVEEEKRRQTWDNLRATVGGVALALRARWSAVVLYRLRGLLVVLLLARLIMIGALLYDLTAFSGEYLNYLVGGITPQVPVPVGVLFLALMMTASLLLPLTGLGFDTALGLFVSTLSKQRIYVGLAQIALSAIRIGIVVFLVVALTRFRGPGLIGATDVSTWLLLVAFAALGDWGFSFLYLGFFAAEIWPEVPYSVLIGPALLLFIFMQTAATDLLLALAIRQGERRE
ncbi:MAG: hypothetical protein H7Y09_07710 [Chitinophagaceae bacterium]|nr:hypothetical protein [Anaerolineae bacterium]